MRRAKSRKRRRASIPILIILLGTAVSVLTAHLLRGRGTPATNPPGSPPQTSERAPWPELAPSAAPGVPFVGGPRLSRSVDPLAFSSPADCRRVLATRSVGKSRGPRIGTYNVRWFPDGHPGKKEPTEGGTDVAWLACAIASLDVDALAVQEFKRTPRARERLDFLLAELDRHTEGSWRAIFDDCPADAVQHVGFLWNARAVEFGEKSVWGELNPRGAPCADSLRPGLAVFARFSSGFEATLVSVHLKSGTEPRALALRDASFRDLAATLRARNTVVVAGDWNTMGCPKCARPVSAEEERSRRRAELARDGWSFLPADAACSHFYGRHATLLDGFVLAHVRGESSVTVEGGCRASACDTSSPAAATALSDHCPLVLELTGS